MSAVEEFLSRTKKAYDGRRESELSLLEYLELCRSDPSAHATAA